MQVLWSRAAQARSSCRCSSCLHAATTLARRTTTAASKRRLRISDVFTACYSTILATAAFVDARAKEDRRKEWDRLIDEAKKPAKRQKKVRGAIETDLGSEFGDWEVQNPSIATFEATGIPSSTYKPLQDKPPLSTYKSFLDDSYDSLGLPSGTKVPGLGRRLYGLDWKLKNSTAERIAARDVDSTYRPGFDQDGQWMEEFFDPDLFNREPKRPLHLEKYEDMVANLVNKILQESKVFLNNTQPEANHQALKIQHQMAEIAQRFVALNIGVSRMPTYNYDDIDVIDSQRKALHQSIWAMCFAASEGQADLDVTIAKICYNLLISRAPPSVITYNILLDGFLNMKRYDLAQIVVDSFLCESRFRPNKRTIRLLLDHYRAKSDFEGFNDIIQRMRGTKGDLQLRKRHNYRLSERPVQTWALNHKVLHRAGQLIQKAPRSRPIYSSIILGSLEFRRIRAAVRYARAALREGHDISAETLCAVIKCVVDKLDTYAGSSLLKALLSQWENGSILTITVYSKDLRYHINQLLLLCGINPTSIRSIGDLPSYVSPAPLYNVLRCMRLGTVADAVDRSASFLLQLDATLGMSGLDLSYAEIGYHSATQDTPAQRFEWALQIARKQSRLEKRRCMRREKAEHKGWQLRLQVLNNMLAASSELILVREAEMVEIQIEAKKLKLESLLSEQTPMHPRIAKKYVLALTTRDVGLPAAIDYPMFQGGKSYGGDSDPISYLERKLFDVERSVYHQDLMSELSSHVAPQRRRRIRDLRLKYIENILDLYLNPKARQRKLHWVRYDEHLANKASRRKKHPGGVEEVPSSQQETFPKCVRSPENRRLSLEVPRQHADSAPNAVIIPVVERPTASVELVLEQESLLPPLPLLPSNRLPRRSQVAV
ncbi:hypothetical protein EG329_010375 [Mollisiaceae sp. DMI_Dod_QoI]|nr:hypothetical protein EG329_010375 [Helotiales sp. DMI_Dod_QoI]